MQDKLQYLSLETTYEVDDTFDSDKFIKLNMRIAHDGVNPNGSHFSVDGFSNAKSSLNYIPILAHVVVDADGKYDFGSHDIKIEEDAFNEGKYKEIYEELPIGVVPEDNGFEIKEYNNKNYVYINSYVWRGYSNYAEDIIKRDKNIKLSIEIIVDKYLYDAKKDLFLITEFRFKGITLLGSNVGTGMVDARATTESFSDDSKERLFSLLTELKKEIDKHQSSNEVDIDGKFTEERKGNVLDEKLEILSKYNLKIEDLDFNIEEMSAEDLEIKLIEFSKSHEDPKLLAFATFKEKYDILRKLVNTMDSSENYTFYWLLDFDDTFLFIQQYKYDDDSGYNESYGRIKYDFNKETNEATITGEWENIYLMWLTAEEKSSIETARNNYAQVKADFESYKADHATPNTEVEELRTFKTTKLAEERKEAETELFAKFEKLNGNEEFEKLKEKSSEYELGALEEKCFALLGKMSANFAANTPKKKEPIKVPVGYSHNESKDGLYERFFEEYKK